MNTSWDIIENPSEPSTGLTVFVPDQHASWPDFFTGVNLTKYPAIIETVACEIGVHDELVGVNFPAGLAQLDPTATPIPADTVEVYVYGGEDEILPRATFYAVLLAFAERLMARPGQPADWYVALGTALDRLRVKMTADADTAG